MVITVTTNLNLLRSLYIPIEYAGEILEVTEMFILDTDTGKKLVCYETLEGIILPKEALELMEPVKNKIIGESRSSSSTKPNDI